MENITAFERTVKRERWLVASTLLAATVACWSWIVPMARDMYGSMTGSAAWMMTATWDSAHIFLLFAMWMAMMTGMMLPSAAPTMLLYGMVVRKGADAASATRRVYLFAGGYLLVWTLFSGAATLLQRVMGAALVLSPMMELRSKLVSGFVLLVAGAYQLTPLKRSCLVACRSPIGFITRFWRPGDAGAFHLGFVHGLYCLGCCWALMLLLFVGGVMNLSVILLLTALILVEKLAPAGAQGGRLSGILMLAAGVWMATR